MMLQAVTFQALTSLSSWYVLFQQQAVLSASESAQHICKSQTVSGENSLYLLLSNT